MCPVIWELHTCVTEQMFNSDSMLNQAFNSVTKVYKELCNLEVKKIELHD